MCKKILFSLEECVKCTQTKELLKNHDIDDVEIVTFPHNIKEWSDDEKNTAASYDVIDILQITAPILWVDREKMIGYLRIRKWIIENKK